jgi:hypothetical protein
VVYFGKGVAVSSLSTEERVSRLEGAFEQIGDRLNSMDANILGLREDMTRGLEGLRGEMVVGIKSVREEMVAGIKSVREEMTAGTKSLHGETVTGFGELRREMNQKFLWLMGGIGLAIVTVLFHH